MRLTAEQVADNFEATAIGFDSLDQSIAAAMYRDAANFVREHLIESHEASRERFEWWVKAEMPRVSLSRQSNGEYLYEPAHTAWQAWQASQTWRPA